MKQTINPKEGLIIIPVKLYGHDCDTVANLALDIGATFF